jgi:hypothetical protein
VIIPQRITRQPRSRRAASARRRGLHVRQLNVITSESKRIACRRVKQTLALFRYLHGDLN